MDGGNGDNEIELA